MIFQAYLTLNYQPNTSIGKNFKFIKIIYIIQPIQNELSLVFISLTHFYCQTQDT